MTLKSNLRFALRKESQEERSEIPPNKIETFGNYLSWFAFEFRHFVVRIVCDPRFATVLFTFLALITNSLLFYPSMTFDVICDVGDMIVSLFNWDYIRFVLWFVSEVTIFGLGMRAFGRFSNQQLMHRYFNSL